MPMHTASLYVVCLVAGFSTAGVAQDRAKAPADAGQYTLDTPLEAIAADPAGAAVLNKDVSGLLQHPAYAGFKSMALNDLEPFSEGKITDETLAVVRRDLRELRAR